MKPRIIQCAATLLLVGVFADVGAVEAARTDASAHAREYYVEECLVRLDFDWSKTTSQEQRQAILRELLLFGFREKHPSGLPLYFSAILSSLPDSLVIYLTDECGARDHIAREATARFLQQQKLEHLEFKVVTEGLHRHLLESAPNGWWKTR